MQSCSFHNGNRTAVADTEPVPRLAVHEKCSARGAVQGAVPDNRTLSRISRRTGMRPYDDASPRHRFADRIVCFAVQNNVDTVDKEYAEPLTGASGEFNMYLLERCSRHRDTPRSAPPVLPAGEFTGKGCEDAAVRGSDRIREPERRSGPERPPGIFEYPPVEVPDRFLTSHDTGREGARGTREKEIEPEFPLCDELLVSGGDAEKIRPSHDLLQRTDTEAGEYSPHVVGDDPEHPHDVFRAPLVFRLELRIMCGDTRGAGVLFADAGHDAPFGDEEELPEIESFRSHDGGDDDILPRRQTPVCSQFHASA